MGRRLNGNALPARCGATIDRDRALGYAQRLGKEFDQAGIGFALDRTGRQADLEAIAVQARDLGARCARLDMDLQQQPVALPPVPGSGIQNSPVTCARP